METFLLSARSEGAFSPSEREACRAVGRRLQEELRAITERFPEHKRQSYGLASELGVDRSVCQRVASALKCIGPDAGIDAIDRLPGVEGLTKFVEGARRVLGDTREVQAAFAAIQQFSRLIEDLSGSHARLRVRIRASPAAPAREDDVDWEIRRRAFSVNAALARSSCEAEIVIAVTRPLPDDDAQIEHASAKAMVGYRSSPGAGAEVVTFYHVGEHQTDEHESLQIAPIGSGSAASRAGESLIRELCTQPLPVVTSRGPRGMAVDVIDPSVTNQAIDLVVSRRTSPVSHPRLHREKVLAHGARVRIPTKRLVFDSLVHRSIAASSVPGITVNHWHPALLAEPRKCWYERLPGSPTIELLGSADQARGSSAWGSHARLCTLLLEQLGWAPQDFLVYRVDVEYPIWSAMYVKYFDFGDSQ